MDVENLCRRFGPRSVLKNINFDCTYGQSVCITGPNGSGKSTLLRILASLLSPTSGKVTLSTDSDVIDAAGRRKYVRLVSPEIGLYDELTGYENLRFLADVSGTSGSRDTIERALDAVGLGDRRNDRFGEYSSGMKQRLKVASALMSEPPVLLLDEPTSNLDEDGRALIHRIMDEQKSRGMFIYATNEPEEQSMGDRIVRLG